MFALGETELRSKLDAPTITIFNIWHKQCLRVFQRDLDVLVADRRENPQLREISGEMNAAAPAKFENKLFLVLWLDTIRPPKSLIVTHELGHWILTLEGYKCFADPARNFDEVVGNLNSLVQHPPLFALQRSIGHEPQGMIDLKATNDLTYLGEKKERDPKRYLPDALLIADDLLNCSENCRILLRNTLNKRFPNTNKLVRSILDVVEGEDINSPENNSKLCLKLVKTLKLGHWSEYNQIRMISDYFHKQTPRSGPSAIF